MLVVLFRFVGICAIYCPAFESCVLCVDFHLFVCGFVCFFLWVLLFVIGCLCGFCLLLLNDVIIVAFLRVIFFCFVVAINLGVCFMFI